MRALPFHRAKLQEPERFADGTLQLIEDPWTAQGHVTTITVHDAGAHGRAKKKSADEAHWAIQLDPVPSFRPPPDVVDMSRRAGARDGALRTLAIHWPGSATGIQVRFSASYSIDGKKYALEKALAQSRPKTLKYKGNKQTSLLPIGGIFGISQGDAAGMLTIQYPVSKEPFSVTISGLTKVELDALLVDRLEDQVWTTLSTFISLKTRA